jgi:hypothetical protein
MGDARSQKSTTFIIDMKSHKLYSVQTDDS